MAKKATMKTKVTPIGDKILVKRSEAETKSKGGIVLPDTAKEKPRQGTVLAVGSGQRLKGGKIRELQVKVGETVLFTSYGGTEVKINGEDLLLVTEEDILAIVV